MSSSSWVWGSAWQRRRGQARSRGCVDTGLAIIRWVGCLPTFSMREAVLGTVATSMALYGVGLADVEGHTLSSADTAAAKSI